MAASEKWVVDLARELRILYSKVIMEAPEYVPTVTDGVVMIERALALRDVPQGQPVFSLEEVDSLNAYQLAGVMHPFTCICGCDLVATVRGWICCKCDYTQNWAHEWMKNDKWKNLLAARQVPVGHPTKNELPEFVDPSESLVTCRGQSEPHVQIKSCINPVPVGPEGKK